MMVSENVAILSIHPKYANAIYTGKKTYEYRKKVPFKWFLVIEEPVNRAQIKDEALELKAENPPVVFLLYETLPVMKVTGYFKTFNLYWGSSDELIEKTFPGSGITTNELLQYLMGKMGNAIAVNSICQFVTPYKIQDFGLKRPPQNYCFPRCYPEGFHVKGEV